MCAKKYSGRVRASGAGGVAQEQGAGSGTRGGPGRVGRAPGHRMRRGWCRPPGRIVKSEKQFDANEIVHPCSSQAGMPSACPSGPSA